MSDERAAGQEYKGQIEPVAKVSRATAPHYTWGGSSDGWHLVRQERLSVIEEEMPPGAWEVRHSHRRAQQFFYVLTGEAQMEVEGAYFVLGQNEGLRIAPGVRHQIRNASTLPVRFLVISEPPSHGDRVVCDPPAAG